MVAAIGCLTLAGSALGQDRQNAQHHPSSAEYQQQGASPPVPAQSLPSDQAKPYRPEWENARDYNEASFCEARQSRIAAQQANRTAENAFWLSLWGTIGLVMSLIFTGWAAQAASRAALAAENAVELGEDMSRKELRAWITQELNIKGVTVTDDTVTIEGFVTTKNVGPSPANYTFHAAGTGYIGPIFRDHVKATEAEVKGYEKNIPLMPGASETNGLNCAFSVPKGSKAMSRGVLPYLTIVTAYETVDLEGMTSETYRIYKADPGTRVAGEYISLNQSVTVEEIKIGRVGTACTAN